MTPLPIQQMLDSHPVFYCTIDRNGIFVHVCKSSISILGYQPQELVGTPFLNLVVEQDRFKSCQVLQQLFNGRFIENFENRYYHKDGSIVSLLWSSQWNEDEQMLYSIAHDKSQVVLPVHIQQLFARKLKQSTQRVSEIFDRITDGFFSVDEEWRFTYINKSAQECFGIPKEDLLARTIWECFPDAIGSLFEKEYRRSFERQETVCFEAYYPQPLNKWFEVTAYPSPTTLSVFFRDVTERKKTEEEMRKLSFMIRETDNLVLLCDAEEKIKWFNDAFLQKTGYSTEEVRGKRVGDLLGGQETDWQVLARARQRYKKGKAFKEEVLCYTKSGVKFWVEMTGRPIFDKDGNITEIFCIQTDVTERKVLEDQLQKEREARQRKITAAVIQAQEQERSEIGREMHDNINQLLTTVKLYLEVSLGQDIDREEITHKSIQLLQHSINEIRNLSKRLSAPTIGHILLGDSLKELCEKLRATNLFHITLDAAVIDELEVDEKLHLAIYRILQEHLTNIVKHAEAKNVAVVMDFVDGDLVMKVTDDGKGFNTNARRGGIGITNMISRAENLNGTLSINSAPGLGCVLIARFPLAL